MILAGGSRISHHLREFNHHHCSPSKPPQALASGLMLSGNSRIVQLSYGQHSHRFVGSSAGLQSKSPGEIPVLSGGLSPGKDDVEIPSEGLSSVAGGIVALGKFDALHVGHRELAIQASKVGAPFLLSFVGMAEVLGWEPRAPVVAKCDRRRIFSLWAPYCGNVAPAEFEVGFSSVRHLTPRQFVEKLSKELGVSGVVAGENYRFGYKAAGDALELVRLCEEYGLGAYIIESVMDRNQELQNMINTDSKERGQVSSTRVRHALAAGDMDYVSELLGRPHRLMMMLKDKESILCGRKWMVSAPKSCLLNLPPKDGVYENCSLIVSNNSRMKCRVHIDSSEIHIEPAEVTSSDCNVSQDLQLLGIEFGD